MADAPRQPAPPRVSVVVPTVDRVALLARCLRGIASQAEVAEPGAVEVLVVHDGDPGVEVLLRQWGSRLPLRPLRIAERGASAKRNAGWRAARAPVIAYTDDDCEPRPGWLAAGLDALDADPTVDLVQGSVLPHPEDAGVQGVFARVVVVDAPEATYANANLLYRRTALERVGGYDERLRSGEDTDLAWRVLESGGRAAWVPDAGVWHAVRPATLAQHLRSLPRWGDLPVVVGRHPQLRELLHRRVFWKDTHPRALLALGGLALSARDARALLLAVPLLARRTRDATGLRGGAQLALSDVVEVLVVAAGSARCGTLLL